MRKILFEFPGHGQGKLFNPKARDSALDPFIYLRDKLKTLGYQLDTADDHSLKGCAWVWFWDTFNINVRAYNLLQLVRYIKRMLLTGPKKLVPQRDIYADCIHAGLQERMVLFIGEPPVVFLQNWDLKIHNLFPVVFTWNDNYVDGKKYHKFCWPIARQFPEITPVPFAQKKLLVNISGNKFSKHPQELYSARRHTIRYFEQKLPNQFDLYGMGWNQPGSRGDSYPSYRGLVDHKWDVYPQYRFGVCYENMFGHPGWITEKIFDCMRADCVPIYWGAPNINDFVDTGTFIDRSKFKSEAEMADFLQSMSEVEYNQYRRAIQAYLRTERFAAFLPPAFAENIIRVLGL